MLDEGDERKKNTKCLRARLVRRQDCVTSAQSVSANHLRKVNIVFERRSCEKKTLETMKVNASRERFSMKPKYDARPNN